ncbi:MAG: 2-oxoacid:acceptor oxidoreductase family protein [Thermodesulfobacteriota bacterium]
MLLKLVFSGFGGQGVLMMGYVLAFAAMEEDRHVTFLPAYGAEMRGGTANCTVVISDKEIASPVASHPDVVVAMNYPSMVKYQNMVKSGGFVFLNSDLISEDLPRADVKVVKVPANALAHEMGNDRVLNLIMLGAVAAVTGIVSPDGLEKAVGKVLEGKKQALIDINRAALANGREFINSGRSA